MFGRGRRSPEYLRSPEVLALGGRGTGRTGRTLSSYRLVSPVNSSRLSLEDVRVGKGERVESKFNPLNCGFNIEDCLLTHKEAR